MEPKKNIKYDLERKSPLFFFIGLVVALICVTAAFEWRGEYDRLEIDPNTDIFDPPIEIVITRIPEPVPPKPLQKVTPDQPKPSTQVVETMDDLIEELDRPLEIDVEEIAPDVQPEVREEEPEVFEGIVETMPSFPGGEKAFYKYIGENIRYTRQARTLGITGTVYVQFVIDENGKITQVQAIRGLGAGLDEEAVRVLKNAPDWNPGKQRGRAVKVRMVVPIHFKLQ